MTLLLASIQESGACPLGRARLLYAAWRRARCCGARFVVAVDDVQPPRPGSPLDDLAWLGLDWDALERRSENSRRHAAAAERLEASGRLYPCFENQDELRAKADRQRRNGTVVRYDRGALRMTDAQRATAEAGGKRPHWRFRLSDHPIAWTDARRGPTECVLATQSDPILRAADGHIDAVLATAADAIALGATHLLAGAESLAACAIHLDLLEALGGVPPRDITHLPILREAAGPRLQGQSVRALRQDGIAPAALRAWFEALDADGTAPIVIGDLLAHNRVVLASLPFAEATALLPGADEAFWLSVRGDLDLITDARERLRRVGDG